MAASSAMVKRTSPTHGGPPLGAGAGAGKPPAGGKPPAAPLPQPFLLMLAKQTVPAWEQWSFSSCHSMPAGRFWTKTLVPSCEDMSGIIWMGVPRMALPFSSWLALCAASALSKRTSPTSPGRPVLLPLPLPQPPLTRPKGRGSAPAKPAVAAAPRKPAAAASPGKPAIAAAPGKPAVAAAPGKPAKPASAATPAQPAKPASAAPPGQPAKPAAAAASGKPAVAATLG
mmetsp:Transcript_95147/g.278181  ORF Transcript_95147/g.278181 Transcript_95147/m.278181 type:complete len:228 (-) Transcript_95147:158-841(-)